jgi:hypothetical protein
MDNVTYLKVEKDDFIAAVDILILLRRVGRVNYIGYYFDSKLMVISFVVLFKLKGDGACKISPRRSF